MIHLQVPFQIRRGRALTVEQDSLEEITQSVGVIVATRTGERVAQPDFGLPDPTFALALEPDELASIITRLEPRASLSISVVGASERDVTVEVSA